MTDMKPVLDTLSEVPSAKAEWTAPTLQEVAVSTGTEFGFSNGTDATLGES